MRRIVTLLGCAALLAGCGEQNTKPTLAQSSSLVDRSKTPYINALELDAEGDFLMTTNKGFFRIAKDGSKVTPIRDATVTAAEGSSPVGTFLEIATVGDRDELVGSGHPDDPDALPPFLGFMRSNDGGKTWNVVSRLGTADLHVIRQVGRTLYAWDAVLGAVLITTDGGRTWAERFTPKELVLDMVVDPADPDYILISTEGEIYRSANQGKGWRPSGRAERARFAWVGTGELYRATKDGAWWQSKDRGTNWERLGELPGEPWKITAVDARTLHVALADGSIASTTDGGRTWKPTFEVS
jgi:hypothetical protein